MQVRAHACDASHAAHRFNTISWLRLPAHVVLPFLLTAALCTEEVIGARVAGMAFHPVWRTCRMPAPKKSLRIV